MIFTEEDKTLVKKFIQIKNRGYYCSGEQLTKVYNRVLEKNRSVTNCSACLRAMVTELEKALRQWETDEAKKAASGAATEEEPQDNERGEKGDEPTEEKKNKRGRKPKKANGK